MENQISMSDQFLRLIYQNIEENLDNENFSVEDLAQNAGLSRSMLHRKLIKLTGKSASDLITEKRLIRARELLENDVATASEIAYKVGFNSPSYFTKVFKNYYHVSPGDVRKGTIPLLQQIPEETNRENQTIHRRNARSLNSVALIVLLAIAMVGTGIYFITRVKKPNEKSIAILPFDNLSSADENQYFADGIVEDLLNRLSQIDGLKVISRTSSEMFRNKGNKSIPEIADLLGVNYILEGTVQRETNNIRINIQLIDAKKDDHIFSKQYDRELSEVFKIQSEIAGQIASELSLVLTDQQTEALKQDQTTNLKAFEYKQLGRYHLNRRTRDDLFTSVKYFRLAIKEDPNYALAYAELADSYYILPWYGHISWQKGRDSSIYFARKALELNSNLGEAHTILGAIYDEFDLNYTEAIKEFLKAIKFKPNHAPAYQYYSEFLCTAGKLNEAREILNKAIRIDPYSYIIRYASSLLYYKEEKFELALSENQISQELVKDHASPIALEFNIYRELKNEPAAVESFKKLGKLTGEWTSEEVDCAYKSNGLNGLIWFFLIHWKWNNEFDKAASYAILGKDNKALSILESAANDGKLVPFVLSNHEFKRLYSNPRFIALRKKMGLPPL
jgi:TolB-like protein/AraC-like DNA-binding protein